jgi:hypothetical protein
MVDSNYYVFKKHPEMDCSPLALKDNCTNNLGVLHLNMLGTISTIRKSKTNFGIN